MHLFVNALAASAGGGITYLRNVLPALAKASVQTTALINSSFREQVGPVTNVCFLEMNVSPFRRFVYEQSKLPEVIRRSNAEVLLSTGNFALRKPPIPQILLSRNSIYTCSDYYRDLRRRHEYRALADTYLRSILAKKSISWADVTVTPSEAFAAELRRWTGRDVVAIYHGFDRAAFAADLTPFNPELEAKLDSAHGALKLLFVSHYNYYRNFETLIRALPLLRQKLPHCNVKILLTCQLAAGMNPGAYRPDAAANLIKSLGVSDMVVELGSVPYQQLHQLYSRSDIYVTPAYTETFAHPLVEAMNCGLPIVASDIPIHREICGSAAVYFPRFSAPQLAERVSQLVALPAEMKRLAAVGSQRSHLFSWNTHVEKILELAGRLVVSRQGKS
jgi:glycosyltransferase involved in cell wall biosynthesis